MRMSRAAVVRPVRAEPPASSAPQKAGLPPAPRRRRRPPEGRLFLVGLLISLVLHAALLLFGPGLTVYRPGPTAPETPAAEEGAPGVRVLQLRAVAEAPTQPAPEPLAPRRVVPLPPAPPLPETGTAEPGRTASIAERLSRRQGDARIWAPVPEHEVEPLLPGQVLLERVRAALADSLPERALDPNLDWTWTDSQGRKWGFSQGKIHLGGLTIPVGELAPPPGRREEIQQRLREWEEIQRQGATENARAVQQERARAIRERRDAERRERTDGT
jgi:hypothetical protein